MFCSLIATLAFCSRVSCVSLSLLNYTFPHLISSPLLALASSVIISSYPSLSSLSPSLSFEGQFPKSLTRRNYSYLIYEYGLRYTMSSQSPQRTRKQQLLSVANVPSGTLYAFFSFIVFLLFHFRRLLQPSHSLSRLFL